MNNFVQQVTQPQKPIASRLAGLDMELTERCNNDCIHCCINLTVMMKNEKHIHTRKKAMSYHLTYMETSNRK